MTDFYKALIQLMLKTHEGRQQVFKSFPGSEEIPEFLNKIPDRGQDLSQIYLNIAEKIGSDTLLAITRVLEQAEEFEKSESQLSDRNLSDAVELAYSTRDPAAVNKFIKVYSTDKQLEKIIQPLLETIKSDKFNGRVGENSYELKAINFLEGVKLAEEYKDRDGINTVIGIFAAHPELGREGEKTWSLFKSVLDNYTDEQLNIINKSSSGLNVSIAKYLQLLGGSATKSLLNKYSDNISGVIRIIYGFDDNFVKNFSDMLDKYPANLREDIIKKFQEPDPNSDNFNFLLETFTNDNIIKFCNKPVEKMADFFVKSIYHIEQIYGCRDDMALSLDGIIGFTNERAAVTDKLNGKTAEQLYSALEIFMDNSTLMKNNKEYVTNICEIAEQYDADEKKCGVYLDRIKSVISRNMFSLPGEEDANFAQDLFKRILSAAKEDKLTEFSSLCSDYITESDASAKKYFDAMKDSSRKQEERSWEKIGP